MLCESCHEHEATILFTTITGDNKVIAHLCPACATEVSQEQAAAAEVATPKMQPAKVKTKKTVNVVVGHLPKSEGRSVACPGCGMTYEEFRKIGRLGCPQCYRTFSASLRRLLKRIHGADRHVGRLPGKGTAEVRSDDVERLQAELAQAVDEEAYERAAELRDLITRMKGSDA